MSVGVELTGPEGRGGSGGGVVGMLAGCGGGGAAAAGSGGEEAAAADSAFLAGAGPTRILQTGLPGSTVEPSSTNNSSITPEVGE